jgi:hypothetical protein
VVDKVKYDISNPAEFTGRPVYVSPGVSPEASAYAAGVAARQAGRQPLKKLQTPVGGGPAPSVPRLDGPFVEGATMQQMGEQQMDALRAAQVQLSVGQVPANVGGTVGPVYSGQAGPSIVEQPAQRQLYPQQAGRPTTASLGIQPMDVLPNEARQDTAFIEGHGSMIAGNQPHLVAKYGVVRNGQRLQPGQMTGRQGGPAPKQLRPETVKDMETLAKLQQQSQASQPVGSLSATEEDAASRVPDAARASRRVNNLPGDDNVEPSTKEEQAQVKRMIDGMDEFDLDQFRTRLMKDILNNDGQRKLIEDRLEALDITDLILHNRIKQRVPIIPGKFEPTFQSMTAEEDLAIKRLIMQESKSIEVSERYFIDKYALMSITIGLDSVNGKPMGRHVDDHGNFEDKMFTEKFNRVLKLPVHMLASLANHHFWFEVRVRKLFVAEKVGNG